MSMAEIHCPICNRPNDANAERCWFCQAVLPKNGEASARPQEDWLDSFRDKTPPPEDENQNPAIEPEPGEEDVPDWLARIREREQEKLQNSEESPAEPQQAADSTLPDWLKEIQAGGSASKTEAELSAAGADSTPEPSGEEQNDEDWLKSLAGWQPKPPEAGTEEEPEAAAEEKPQEQEEPALPQNEPLEPSDSDWLKGFMQQPEPPVAPVENDAHEETPVFIETPAEITPSTEAAPEPAANETVPPATEEPPQTAIADEEPDWLSNFKELNPKEDLAGQVIPPARDESDEKPAFDDSTLLAWMEQKKEEPITPEAIPAPEDIPAETPPLQEEPARTEANESIEKAALPPWLQALRPEKKPAKPAAEPTQLGHNPLAEIEGALQENIHQFYTRPQTYGASLTISDNQKKRAQILQNLAEANRWDTQEAAETPESNAWIIQLIVSLLLLIAAFLPAFVKNLPVSYPSLYPPEVVEMYNGINGLTPQTPVLVAADFDGSLYGELSLSSQAVFEHLMGRNIPIASLSTTPTGATLLQEILRKAELNQTSYSSGNIVNLGYLPGGSMGLQALAANPISAMPKDVQMQSPWDQAPLQIVHQLSDFGAILVITENADTARYWIEQVQPVLGNTPIYIIISAQSAPLLQPYYDSQQINGYLAGLNSAAVYEQMQARSGSATASYPAYQIALLLVTAMIFIAGIVALVTPRRGSERAER